VGLTGPGIQRKAANFHIAGSTEERPSDKEYLYNGCYRYTTYV
jgi:hypothetical protein